MTLWCGLVLWRNNCISRAPPASSALFNPLSRSLSQDVVNVYHVNLTRNSVLELTPDIRSETGCVCFSHFLCGFLFIGQQTHVVAPQRHRNPLRINQWQDGAFLINSVWSCRCIQPRWHRDRHESVRKKELRFNRWGLEPVFPSCFQCRAVIMLHGSISVSAWEHQTNEIPPKIKQLCLEVWNWKNLTEQHH